MKITSILITILAGIAVAVVGWQVYLRVTDIKLPSGEAVKEVIVIDEETGEVVGGTAQPEASAEEAPGAAVAEPKEKIGFITQEVMVTEGVRHSVPLEEIIGGGPPRDGIPSIDNPQFTSVEEAQERLDDDKPGLALSLRGVNRFYPFQILVWHEIVNDTIDSQRLLVTYCPLCFAGIVFDPLVKGERVEFGTSGKLWQSNLVMYDRRTESLWSQVLGEAIVGEMTGTRLKVLPSDIVRFGEWRRKFPEGEVLSRKTGSLRAYGIDPYGDYYTTPGVFFPVSARDDRLSEKELILGLVIDGKAKAYWPQAVKTAGEIEDEFQGKIIVGRHEQDLDVVRLYEKRAGGELVRINPFPTYWFSWVAAHPKTELYK